MEFSSLGSNFFLNLKLWIQGCKFVFLDDFYMIRSLLEYLESLGSIKTPYKGLIRFNKEIGQKMPIWTRRGPAALDPFLWGINWAHYRRAAPEPLAQMGRAAPDPA